MASDVLTATELMAVLTVYCIVFCPILCWAISGSVPFEQSLRSLHPRA
ncbi:hypothetical protein IQ260_25440 [Leptolyngbya cf. ectocarpi LEGE 11479]|uniref:Uncharacterized protein n=1 Tax=Leptolyngbya cf. ectocarpi LEGE 11479 TaxID=1828722 RepID=A0A928ZYS6_LEPEC|nr:hypothetical protein [Leptolyngbya ectocarpi]MBE9069989.1 hypothetical protein [Leptolyngbya cf. ectocarpi LEGE 11479]